MHLAITFCLELVSRYSDWLTAKKLRPEIIVVVPVFFTLALTLFAPSSFFDWYYSSELVSILAPIVIIPAIPFYLVAFHYFLRKG